MAIEAVQSGLDNFLNGLVNTAAEDSANPTLLLRGEMNGHGGRGPWLRHHQSRGKDAFGQVECVFFGGECGIRSGST